MPLFFKRIEGRYGRIEVPYLATRIGETASWSVNRREDKGPESDFYNFHAILTWITDALFADEEYVKEVIVRVGRDGAEHRVVPVEGPGQRTVLNGRTLIMDRVRLEKISPDPKP